MLESRYKKILTARRKLFVTTSVWTEMKKLEKLRAVVQIDFS